jgi:hypothetical protein
VDSRWPFFFPETQNIRVLWRIWGENRWEQAPPITNKLTTTLLMLGAITVTATSTVAQPGWNDCNPNAPRCRIYGSPSPPTGGQGPRPRTHVYRHTHHHVQTQMRRPDKIQVPRNSSGSFAKFAAIRRASTLVMIAILVQGNERRP